MKVITTVILVLALLVSGCNAKLSGSAATETIQDFASELPKEIAMLPLLDMSSVKSFQKYQEFTDRANTLTKILNEKGDGIFDIPQLEVTKNSYQKISRAVTEYGPLINNYNEVVETARVVDKGKTEKEEFYKAAGIFGLEVALIYGAVFYGFSFKSVGIVYRAVGLNRIAPICGTCVSSILSSAHWMIRGTLVEGTSKAAENLIDLVEKYYESGTVGSVDEAMEFFKDFTDD